MHPADIVDVKDFVAVGNALGEPFEAIAKADDFEVVVDRLDSHGADHAVDPGRRAAAYQYRQPSILSFISHIL
jgi:hypothetical protein